ncbi:FecR family protein [Cyclobacterium lianum]|uniref:FecR family protein n=1 Tax=Cyclobacterium lianum TaxID=388280 RepID=A0A1M7QNB3_9BACT|nr:FecR domain-containing protein [Cyclobacterium lianum]SHN32989.1 FecR family protein [Cyclobacterium lianum]
MDQEKLKRFLNNQTTPLENREIRDWLDKKGSEEQFLRKLREDWDFQRAAEVSSSRREKILDQIHKATLKPSGVNHTFYFIGKFGRMAASFLLLLFSGYFLLELGFREIEPEPVTEVAPYPIRKSTGAGEKMRLLLPDKSELILNSLSSITFYSDYGTSNREITLEGEAFFSVESNQKKPFIVRSGDVITTALGTAFNVYARKEAVRVALTAGKVEVARDAQLLSLLPGEMASEKKDRQYELIKEKFDPEQTTLWKEGKIRFQSKPFSEIIHTLESWYGVEFQVKAFEDRKVTGLFNNESLDDILTGLSFSLGFEYQIDEKRVQIKF